MITMPYSDWLALKVNKSVHIANPGRRNEVTFNNLHVLNHALKRFLISFAKHFLRVTKLKLRNE